MKRLFAPLLFVFALFAAGCTSTVVRIETAPLDPSSETALGPASGSSQGFMILHCIPVGQNERFQKAYDQALYASGGTRLVDIKISESWWSALLVNGYTHKVEGTAVRKR